MHRIFSFASEARELEDDKGSDEIEEDACSVYSRQVGFQGGGSQSLLE